MKAVPVPTVLLVEDSPLHQTLLANAFRKVGYSCTLDIQPDGEGAWAAIQRMRRQRRELWPRFAVIDLGLPGMTGIELIDRIRHEPGFEDWPIVVLTASTDPEDLAESLMAHATSYVVKPSGAEHYPDLARTILDNVGEVVAKGSRDRARP